MSTETDKGGKHSETKNDPKHKSGTHHRSNPGRSSGNNKPNSQGNRGR
jgi:hypothetical protein